MAQIRNSEKILVLIGDITAIPSSMCDVIVNAANHLLQKGGGVDAAIHNAAGERLQEYCYTLRGCNTGQAKLTPPFDLEARYKAIIHAVGPYVKQGCKPTEQNREDLRSCYTNSLDLAVKNDCEMIAFPCISTGVFNYPFDDACSQALEAVKEWLSIEENSKKMKKISFCCFTEGDGAKFAKLIPDIFEGWDGEAEEFKAADEPNKEDSNPSPEEDSNRSPAKDSNPSPEEDSNPSPEEDSNRSPAKDSNPSPEEDSNTSPEKDSNPSPGEDSNPSAGKTTGCCGVFNRN